MSENAKAARCESAVASQISSALVVLSAVRLDDQAKFEADKVNDPRPNRNLPPELGVREATAAKNSP